MRRKDFLIRILKNSRQAKRENILKECRLINSLKETLNQLVSMTRRRTWAGGQGKKNKNLLTVSLYFQILVKINYLIISFKSIDI